MVKINDSCRAVVDSPACFRCWAIKGRQQKVKVFVYNKDTNVESKEWAKKLMGSFEIIDSSLI